MPRLYVGRLNSRVSERELKRFFDGYGKIREIMMKNGYAFLDFDDYHDADDAVYDLNGKELMGDRIILEHAKGTERGTGGIPYGSRSSDRGRVRDDYRDNYSSSSARKQRARDKYGPPVRTKWQVRIENLSSRISWQDLKDYVRPHAEVTYADAHKKERGVATVCVASYDDMRNIIRKMDNAELNGKRIKIIDESYGSRSHSHSRSRSRSRSRSKSRSRRSRSRSRRRSRSRSRSDSRSRSRTPKRHSRSRSKSKSISRSRSRSRTPKRSKTRSRSRSRSRSAVRSRSRSRSASRD